MREWNDSQSEAGSSFRKLLKERIEKANPRRTLTAEDRCAYRAASAAKHYFCSICGIYTHHQRRSVPSEYGVNIACVEGVKIEDYKDVKYLDGRDNHPKDAI